MFSCHSQFQTCGQYLLAIQSTRRNCAKTFTGMFHHHFHSAFHLIFSGILLTRTNLIHFFMLNVFCLPGIRLPLIHNGFSPLRFCSNGFCPYGPRCHFIHNSGENDNPNSKSQWNTNIAQNMNSNDSQSSGSSTSSVNSFNCNTTTTSSSLFGLSAAGQNGVAAYQISPFTAVSHWKWNLSLNAYFMSVCCIKVNMTSRDTIPPPLHHHSASVSASHHITTLSTHPHTTIMKYMLCWHPFTTNGWTPCTWR